MKESELYRKNLDEIYARFGQELMLSVPKVSEFLGWDRETVLKSDIPKKRVGSRYHITATGLANWLSKE